MMRMKALLFSAILAGSALCVLLLICQLRLRAAEGDLISKHEIRLHCLAIESQKYPTCRAKLKDHPEDFDYCAEAVLDCKRDGIYTAMQKADGIYYIWDGRSRAMRILLALFIIIFGLSAIAARYCRRLNGDEKRVVDHEL